MKKTDRLPQRIHRAVLTVMAVLTIPALGSILFVDMTPSKAAILERAMPVWSWMIGVWCATIVYFCGCMIVSTDFREALLARLSGFMERDEREEMMTAKAARSVFLVTLAGFLAAGVLGMVRLNVFTYSRWEGASVPPLTKVGPYELRRGTLEKKGMILWPSLGLQTAEPPRPDYTEFERGNALYFYAGGSLFGPEVSRTFFALALIQVLLLQLFARRARV